MADTMTVDREGLQCLLEKVYRERGLDFRAYKESSLTRRLGRRLGARGTQSYADYSCILDRDPSEYDRLFNDLTIKVTSFFRDDFAFQALKKVVLPTLTDKGAMNIRIWSAGCATGEEPYSIAMLLMEMLGEEIGQWNIDILGTDVDARALALAQKGHFGLKAVEGIPQAWLGKYFVCDGNGLHTRPLLGQLITFKQHNLVSDPPYHDLDLVVCRNVLIYFDQTLQTQVLKRFHEGLKDDGFLLLGKAETPLGETRALFDCLDSKAKLFRKVGGRKK